MTALGFEDLFVLVVEPSSTQRRIICQALQRCAIRSVAETDSGIAALQRLAADPPDLVLSSLYLPDMTGTDLLHRIRESGQHSDMPFMLVSSETRFRYLDPVRQAGVVGILPKPFSDAELLAVLGATLDLIDTEGGRLDDIEPQSLKVLLVDDSPMARRYISRILGNLGIEHVDHAADGIEALSMLERHYYDFVVTDYNMPHMDGRELVDHIRQSPAHASVPVLMVTSEQNAGRLAAVQRSGVSAICDKPFEPATVGGLIRRMIATA
jgi:two-component system, chemotaxis family, chemotaxis protein CheY